MDEKRRQKIQIRLSTMILLIAIAALTICMVNNRMNYESKFQQLNHELEIINQELEIAKTQTEIGVRSERMAPEHPTMRALNEKLKLLQDKK